MNNSETKCAPDIEQSIRDKTRIMSDEQQKRETEFIQNYLHQPIRAHIVDGRIYEGYMHCVDHDCNIILADSYLLLENGRTRVGQILIANKYIVKCERGVLDPAYTSKTNIDNHPEDNNSKNNTDSNDPHHHHHNHSKDSNSNKENHAETKENNAKTNSSPGTNSDSKTANSNNNQTNNNTDNKKS